MTPISPTLGLKLSGTYFYTMPHTHDINRLQISSPLETLCFPSSLIVTRKIVNVVSIWTRAVYLRRTVNKRLRRQKLELLVKANKECYSRYLSSSFVFNIAATAVIRKTEWFLVWLSFKAISYPILCFTHFIISLKFITLYNSLNLNWHSTKSDRDINNRLLAKLQLAVIAISNFCTLFLYAAFLCLPDYRFSDQGPEASLWTGYDARK